MVCPLNALNEWDADTSPVALMLPRKSGLPRLFNKISWIITSPSIIIISSDIVGSQFKARPPPNSVAVPTYLPSNVVVGTGAWAATGVANMRAAIVKSMLARPNMLLSLAAP